MFGWGGVGKKDYNIEVLVWEVRELLLLLPGGLQRGREHTACGSPCFIKEKYFSGEGGKKGNAQLLQNVYTGRDSLVHERLMGEKARYLF